MLSDGAQPSGKKVKNSSKLKNEWSPNLLIWRVEHTMKPPSAEKIQQPLQEMVQEVKAAGKLALDVEGKERILSILMNRSGKRTVSEAIMGGIV